jgi:hypothetical protein
MPTDADRGSRGFGCDHSNRGSACRAREAAVKRPLTPGRNMVTITPYGTHHVVAECRDCSWRSEDYKAGEAKARRHATETGHTVVVERGQARTFNPKP